MVVLYETLVDAKLLEGIFTVGFEEETTAVSVELWLQNYYFGQRCFYDFHYVYSSGYEAQLKNWCNALWLLHPTLLNGFEAFASAPSPLNVQPAKP